MDRLVFVTGSVNIAAMLARKAERNGCLNCVLAKTPAKISNGGCSYSVISEERYLPVIKNTILKNRIRIKGIYKEFLKDGEVFYEHIS